MVLNEHQPDSTHFDLASSTPPERGPFRRFIGWFAMFPVAAYLLVFALVMVPGFRYERWGPSKWGPNLQFPFDARGVDADVLIYGDSSAFLAIDPHRVQAETGLKTAVVPNTIGSLPVTGEMGLTRYLSRNKAPRLLILYFTAWDLDYNQTATQRLFEGDEMLLHNGSAHEIATFARAHPEELLAFPFRLPSTIGFHSLTRQIRAGNRAATTLEALGHVNYPEAYPPVDPACELPAADLKAASDATVRDLMRRYTTAQTRVLVYLAPLPGCSNATPVLARSYADIGAAPPSVLPPASFASDGFFAHVQPPAVPAATDLFVAWLRKGPLQ